MRCGNETLTVLTGSNRSTIGTGTRLERRAFLKSRDKALKAVAAFYQKRHKGTAAELPVCVDLLSDAEDDVNQTDTLDSVRPSDSEIESRQEVRSTYMRAETELYSRGQNFSFRATA